MEITETTAVVSGASSGIGRATAEALAAYGSHPVLLARTESDLEDVADRIHSRGGEATVFPVDLSDADAVAAVADDIRAAVGVPDIIVNNAGVGEWRAIDETTPEQAELSMDVPYLAAFYLTRAFVEGMLDRDRGHVVNLTSAAAYVPPPGATAYNASRWAMRGFSRSLRGDFRGTNLGVTLLAAAKVDTPYFENNPGSEKRIPHIAKLFRTLSPEQVAGAVVEAIKDERKRLLLPAEFRAALFLNRLFPGLMQWLTNATGWKREQ
jgi:short-subunit dehydrogenase